MKLLPRIWFPATVMAIATAGAFGLGNTAVEIHSIPCATEYWAESPSADTVKYPVAAWKLRRIGNLEAVTIADSLLAEAEDTSAAVDTLPRITARDTIKVPDSLRFTDPFRFKYYVALFDSLTHVIVRDSLKRSQDSLLQSSRNFLSQGLAYTAKEDSLKSISDSLDRMKIDSIYVADSTARAKEAFRKWYNSLSRRERKKYDAEQMLPIKLAEMDSLREAKDSIQAIKDSIVEYTPRILETYALPDSMQYKRIVSWTVDQDFHKMDIGIPDTTYNYHFYDYPFQRKDVNSAWLGVAGSPVMPYNWFNRTGNEGVDFYTAMESWSFSPSTVPHYNVKTPHTELAYFGTLLGGDAKESDNIHVLTTQNIIPALNFTLSYDRYGGGGMLENETTINKTAYAAINYLGKRYTAHAGFIYNMVDRGENGGIVDNKWIRDTTVDSREITVALTNGHSQIKKKTFFLDQQYRIPFNFINRLKARGDSTYVFNADSLERDITTAFIGHSTEWSRYTRTYTDDVTSAEGKAFYNNVFNYGTVSDDSLATTKLDNKIFMRLQPWSSEGVVSKLDVGVGDVLKHYFDSSSVRGTKHVENTFYVYAGAQGQISKYMDWDAKGHYYMIGYDRGNMDIQGNIRFNMYPFRRARYSPISLRGHFETTLTSPTWYQQHLNTNHFLWDNEFSKISTTKIQAAVDIPRWRFNATVGYALLANNIYYDTLGVVRQNTSAMSVLSASIRKDIKLGPFHMDNQVLLQWSSKPDVVAVPLCALNLKYYLQFVAQKDATKEHNVLEMQVGVNAFYNTQWYAPSWSPVMGVFHNQNSLLYENGPYFDIFLNMQWKRCCIFVKYQNFGKGWPMEKKDYFTANHYIGSQDGTSGLKIGIFWPFYMQTQKHSHTSSSSSQ